jgi:hypothetical protein
VEKLLSQEVKFDCPYILLYYQLDLRAKYTSMRLFFIVPVPVQNYRYLDLKTVHGFYFIYYFYDLYFRLIMTKRVLASSTVSIVRKYLSSIMNTDTGTCGDSTVPCLMIDRFIRVSVPDPDP